jgi:hypothetical protein
VWDIDPKTRLGAVGVAAEAQVVHRSLDGRRFQLSGALDLGLPFTSVLDVAVGGRLHEFTAGVAGLGADVAGALGGTGFDEELSYSGGALLVGRLRPYDRQAKLVEDLLVGVWRGERYCLVTQLYGLTTADLLGLLRTLRIEEHDDGLAVALAPRGGGEFAAPATVVKQIPELGLLEVSPLTDQHVKSLPSWRGLSTPAGEMFTDSLADGKPYFVLAATDTWTTLVPVSAATADQMAGRVGQLRVRLVG